MSESVMTHIIARIRTDFPTKFGIPRQSGLADVPARIVFEPEYRNADALRGIEEYSHLWLIWQFSEAVRDTWSPTVRRPSAGPCPRRARGTWSCWLERGMRPIRLWARRNATWMSVRSLQRTGNRRTTACERQETKEKGLVQEWK